MVTGVKDSADETSLDGRRSHTWRFAEKSRKGRVKVDSTDTIESAIK
jgi:hypothetical protein